MTLRVLFRRIHLIGSLIAGLWLAVSGLTGSMLVFGDRLDELFHPSLYAVSRPGVAAPLETVIANAATAGRAPVTRLRLAGSGTPVHEAWIECDHCSRVWIDPSTAEVHGVRSSTGTTRLALHEVHRRMMLGDAGETAVGIAGIFLLVLTISGLVLWWPRRWSAALKLRLGRGWKLANHDLHRMTGLIVSPLLMLSSLTGVYFIFHEPIDEALESWTRSTSAAVEGSLPGESVTDFVNGAARLFPGAVPTWITISDDPSAPIVIRMRQSSESHPNGRTFITVARDGSIVSVSDPMAARPVSRLINELYPLHIGRTGGLIHRMILVLVGLAPAGFFVTGLLLWWNRSLGRLWRSRIASFRVPELADRSR